MAIPTMMTTILWLSIIIFRSGFSLVVHALFAPILIWARIHWNDLEEHIVMD